MDIAVWRDIVACLPQGRTLFLYERDRYAVMLLRYLHLAGADMAALKKSRFARLFDKEPVRRYIARRGALDFDASDFDFIAMDNPVAWRLTLGKWGDPKNFTWVQTSRRGVNLVLQLNFSNAHDRAFDRLLGPCAARSFRSYGHPESTRERTLAWARIDVDFDSGEALIEEVQSDWVRSAKGHATYGFSRCDTGRMCAAHGRRFRTPSGGRALLQRYKADVLDPLSAHWSETMLAAALFFVVEELGLKTVFMHQFESGNVLKNIEAEYPPPRSLYTDLPRRFCFEKVAAGPQFLEHRVALVTKRARRGRIAQAPMGFWKLDFEEPGVKRMEGNA